MDYTKEIQWLLREKYGGRLTEEAKRDILQIKQGQPVDYVIGFVRFLGCRIDLSMRPLIPRPETEEWTEKAIAAMQTHGSPVRCLDLFAGSGCIGIAVLTHVQNARVDFAEKNKKLLEQIRINCALNGIDPSRYRILESDVFSHIKGTYDYIFANPPYIARKRKGRVQDSVLAWEPHEALFAEDEGLFYIKKLIQEAPSHLASGGRLYLEFDAPQKGIIERLCAKSAYEQVVFHRDQFGKWRYLQANKSKKER